MMRIVAVVVGLLWLAVTPALAAQRYAIYVNGQLRNAPDAATANALSTCVTRFKKKTTQIGFLDRDARAAYAYLQFAVTKETSSNVTSMFMTSNVRIVPAAAKPIDSEC